MDETQRGSLTPAQHEIMAAVWDSGDAGATVAEVWGRIAAGRQVTRTTVLNLVDRLEKRGWLALLDGETPKRYVAVVDREDTAAHLVGTFVDGFFDGSACRLVQGLLGTDRLDEEEIRRLRRLLDEADRRRAGGAA